MLSDLEAEKMIAAEVDKFRNLRDWQIAYDSKTAYKGQLSINPRMRCAVIYAWPEELDSPPMPNDYFLHEVLHCAINGVRFGGSREMEEFLVQDLCALIVRASSVLG